MLAVDISPTCYLNFVAEIFEGIKVAAVVFAGQRRQAAFVLEMMDEFFDPVVFRVFHRTMSRASISLQCHGYEFANTR